LSAVSIADGEWLQRALLGDEDATEETPPFARADLRTLAIAGATGPRWLAVPFVVAGAVAGALAATGEDVWRPLWDGALDRAGGLTDGGTVAALAIGLVLMALVVLTATAASVLTDGGFRLTTPPGRLVSERGLLRRRQVSIDRGRIAAFGVREPLSWRPLGLASVRARITGVGADSGAGAGRTQMHPATRVPEAHDLVRRIFPASPREARPHPRQALSRRIVRATVPVGALAAALLIAGRPVAAAVAASLVVPAARVGWDRWRSLATGFNGRLLRLREGSLSRRTTIVDPAAIVEYRLRSSPFQRRGGLCTLEVRMGRGAGSARALDIGATHAAETARRLDPALLHNFLTPGNARSEP
jgi:putative membrane protein